MPAEQSIQHFSTAALPPGMRFDYWMSILRQSLWPVSEWSGIKDFNVDLKEAALGCLTSMEEVIGPSTAHRTRDDVEHSGDRCYLLFANRRPWQVAHRGQNEHFDPGDCVLVDSQGELETCAPSGFSGLIIKLPVSWVESWLAHPELLAGRRITADSKWGRAFSPIVSQLTPEFAAAPPLPHGVLVDQVGAVLALIAGDVEARAMPDLLKKIQDCIRELCTQSQLTACDVGAALGLPAHVVHRVLAANNLTFASELLNVRAAVALQMLTARSFDQLTIGEIAHQAGFLSPSHFASVVRKRTGHTPSEFRRLTR